MEVLSPVSHIYIFFSHLISIPGIIWTGRDFGDHLSQSFDFAEERTGVVDGKWPVQGHPVTQSEAESQVFLFVKDSVSERLVKDSHQNHREENM